MNCVISREMFHPGMTFIIFMNSKAGAKAFTMKETAWIGAFIVIVNLEYYGMYKNMPVLTVKDPFIPVCYPEIDGVCMEPYHEHIVHSVSVIIFKLVINNLFHHCPKND
jgi:hypothetical protein